MNDEARDVLVAAALRGHRQIKGRMHDRLAEGECALGVLHLAFHRNRPLALSCFGPHEWNKRFGINPAECERIAHLNDGGADFLTIARKMEAPA